MFLKRIIKFRFDDPPSIYARKSIWGSRTWFDDVQNLKKKLNFYGEEHDIQSHMFRPAITDTQDKYCGDCYDIHPIQSQYKGNRKRGGAAEGRHLCMLALNKVNISVVTTILVLHVGNSRSEQMWMDIMFRYSLSHQKHSPQHIVTRWRRTWCLDCAGWPTEWDV